MRVLRTLKPSDHKKEGILISTKAEQFIEKFNKHFKVVKTKDSYFIRLQDGITQYQMLPEIVNPLLRKHIYHALSTSQIKELTAYAQDSATPFLDAKRYIWIHDKIWDTKLVDYIPNSPHPPIYNIPFNPQPDMTADAYLLQIANNDPERVQDILKSVAPIFLDHKPTGTIWWQGRAANGKSAFMNAIYRLFPSDNVRQLTSVGGGRD